MPKASHTFRDGSGSGSGSYTSLLRTLPTLPPTSKQTLLSTIAADITSTFITISQALETGTLSPKHTAPIDRIIDIIHGTEVSHRRSLERKVRRCTRLARRLKAERDWIRAEFGVVVKTAEAVNARWRERVRALQGGNAVMTGSGVGRGQDGNGNGNGVDKGRQWQRVRRRSV